VYQDTPSQPLLGKVVVDLIWALKIEFLTADSGHGMTFSPELLDYCGTNIAPCTEHNYRPSLAHLTLLLHRL
jgi:hypothetical protein